MLRNSARYHTGIFCCSLSWAWCCYKCWEQVLSPSRIHLPCPVLGSGAGPASWGPQHSLPCPSSPTAWWSPEVFPLREWDGVGLREFLCRGWTFCLFLLSSTILKPLTMPNITISEVDALPESDQTLSPTGTCMVGGSSSVGPAVWRLMWWMLYTVTYFLEIRNSHGLRFKTY